MRLRFAIEAQRDVAEIASAIASNNPHSVAAFEAAVDAATERLLQFPKSGRLVHPPSGTRSVILRRWHCRLFYVEEAGDVVAVLSIRSAKRRPLWS